MIKSYLRKVLNVNELTEKLGNKMVYFNKAPEKVVTPYVVYSVINEYGVLFCENKEVETEYIIQVDIFSHGDYTEIEEMIYKIMIENNFIRSNSYDLYEDKTRLNHKVFRFSINLKR